MSFRIIFYHLHLIVNPILFLTPSKTTLAICAYMSNHSLVLACYSCSIFIRYDITSALLLQLLCSFSPSFLYFIKYLYYFSPIFNSFSLVLQIASNIILNTLPSLTSLWISLFHHFSSSSGCVSHVIPHLRFS